MKSREAVLTSVRWDLFYLDNIRDNLDDKKNRSGYEGCSDAICHEYDSGSSLDSIDSATAILRCVERRPRITMSGDICTFILPLNSRSESDPQVEMPLDIQIGYITIPAGVRRLPGVSDRITRWSACGSICSLRDCYRLHEDI